MLPGMIGAVNYGSGPKSLSSEQTVAGKTGTWHCQGAWLGFLRRMLSVVIPRLAVVVITRGTTHTVTLPAAIAGSIYRHLKSAFRHPD